MTDARAICQLNLPNKERFFDQIKENARACRYTAQRNMAVGRTVTICGAGPSLRDEVARLPETDEVWACNSALPWLWDQGVRVTHGLTIDQHEAMTADHEFGRALPVQYLLATSVHPSLVRLVRAHKRRVVFFHSFLGIENPPDWEPGPKRFKDYEFQLYCELYPPSIMAGHGLNGVPRAVCLATGMGFDKIYVVGADCATAVPPRNPPDPRHRYDEYVAWLHELVMYADGRTVGGAYGYTAIATAEIDGRLWATRADMVITAQHLVAMARDHPGRVVLVGDTLPAVLLAKDDAFMVDMPQLSAPGGSIENFAIAPNEGVAA